MLVKICEIDSKSKTACVCDAADSEAYNNNVGKFYVRWFMFGDKNRYVAPKIGMTYTMSRQIEWENVRETERILHGQICHPWPIDTIAKNVDGFWTGQYNPHANKLNKFGRTANNSKCRN